MAVARRDGGARRVHVVVEKVITLADYYMGRDVTYASSLTDALRKNAIETVRRANMLLDTFGQQRKVNSGWRPPQVNAQTPGAAIFSRHMTCEAVDLADPLGDLDAWLYNDTGRLQELQLWMESPTATPGWCHVQIVAPRSGNLVFIP